MSRSHMPQQAPQQPPGAVEGIARKLSSVGAKAVSPNISNSKFGFTALVTTSKSADRFRHGGPNDKTNFFKTPRYSGRSRSSISKDGETPAPYLGHCHRVLPYTGRQGTVLPQAHRLGAYSIKGPADCYQDRGLQPPPVP